MLLLIGDMFGTDLSPYINGAVVSLRVKGDRIALWLKKIDDRNLIKTIGMKLKDLLGFSNEIQMLYEVRLEQEMISSNKHAFLFSTMNQIMTFVFSFKKNHE
jgi:hypothetical protein